ncbi:MAG: hypothetical protein VXW36_04690, partial [Candidatus Thermoplasmatota archaeon]|nr:hypothetical protein [Candidatus Thermoplasmatota archaeon]
MRITVLTILLLAAFHPMISTNTLEELPVPSFSGSDGVELIMESEPNDSNTTGQEVYPGDVVRGTVDMWSDQQDWFSVWLEPGQTLLLTLSHASGDGVSMSVWDEENTNYGASNPAKTRDTLFLGEDETSVGGVYSVAINATMTEAGGGAYVLEIDAGYVVNWYAPEVGWNVASDVYDAKGNIMYTSVLDSYQFAQASSTDTQSAPVWTNGDFWNFSVSMPSMFGVSYEEYHQMTVTGTDTVSGKECYTVSIVGKATLEMSLPGLDTKTVDEENGVACYAKDTLALVHENITFTSKIETDSSFEMMSTSGRSCVDDWGDPDEDCDGVSDDWDDCPGTANGADVDAFGCSDAQNNGDGGGGGSDDTDGDGIPDSNDACPNEYADTQNDDDNDGCPDENGGGNNGGGTGTSDADGDGVDDADDDCPNTPSGESVDFFGCSDSQNGGGNNGGGNNGGGNGGGGFGGGGSGNGGYIDEGCIPSGFDMNEKTVIRSDLTYANGLDAFNFPFTEGKVWSDAAVGSGTLELSIEIGGCILLDMALDASDALPLNYRHIGTESFTVGASTVTANGVQVFAGREGNNDWATPDFTILPSVPDNVARMGLPFAAWINVVGFNEFDETVAISATVNAENAPLMYDNQQLSIDELGAVVVDTMNMSSGDYVLSIMGTQDGFERSVNVAFTVDNDPDFEIIAFDPWLVVPGGVPWELPTPIFIEPLNGFGADVAVSVTLPSDTNISGTLDFASGTTPFMSVLTLSVPENLPAGDYTIIVTGTSGSTVKSDEITLSITSLPEFTLDIDNREQLLTTEETMAISGAINAHNGLDLTLGGALDIIIEPYNQKLLDSAVITWGSIDANGDLTFEVTFMLDEEIPLHNYNIQLNVVTLDGGIAHAASVAFVTESSTISGTATAASTSSVSSGNTEEHDGTDSSAQTIVEESEEENDASGDSETSSETESKSSNTLLIVGSSVAVIAIAAVVGFLVMRGRATGIESKDFSQQLWNQETAPAQPAQPIHTQQMGAIPMQSQPVQQAPVVQQPVAPVVAPAPP